MAEPDKPEEPRPGDFRTIRGMDPAANWLLGVGVDDYLSDRDQSLIPFLLELSEDAVEPFRTLVQGREGARVLGFDRANDFIRQDELLPVVATREWFLGLLDGSAESARFLDADKEIVLSATLDPPDDTLGEASWDSAQQAAEASAPRDEGVVVAAIDDGFAFAHERFRAPDGTTRIEAFWDMSGGFPLPMPPQGELTKLQIDNHIATSDADEDALYRRAGQLDFADPRHKPLAWRASHGTHVLDLAAGSDPGDGGHPIIAVQLPSPVVARTTGELLDFYVWLGVLYIIHQAGNRHVVINISFGYDAGPHDGGGLLERRLSQLIEERNPRARTCVVLPAGNAQLSRCHATIDLSAGAPIELDWIVQPDDRTHSVIEIWLPSDPEDGERMNVTVLLPDRTPFPIREPEFPTPAAGLPSVPLLHAGQQMGLVEVWQRRDRRRMFRIAIAPTARTQPDTRVIAPAGRWTLRFEAGANPLREPAHAWVQRDDSLYGYPQRGRQSYFEHENYQRFDGFGYEMDDDPPAPVQPCPVTRTSLLNAIATSPNVVVVGGYRSRDCRIAPYSSGGPNTPEEPHPRLKPDALSPSDGSPAHPGVLGAGARSGARLAMDGTSVAAPQLARRIAMAEWLTREPDPGRPAVMAEAIRSGVACAIPTAPDRAGHGRLTRLDPVIDRFVPGD